MDISDYVELLQDGVEGWNRWRELNPEAIPNLRNTDLRRLSLHNADLRWVDLREADLSWTDLRRANLNWANLTRANLRHATASYSRMEYANLDECNLSNAKLQKAVLREAIGIDAQFLDADLRQADLYKINLQSADLKRISAYGANFTLANLFGSDLWNADLRHVNFEMAMFKGTRLRECNLVNAQFEGNQFEYVDFDQAQMGRTTFVNVDFSLAKNLQTVLHLGPSFIGVESLSNSIGMVPEGFYRGVGISERVLEAFRTHAAPTLEFQNCYLYFVPENEDFAKQLQMDLQHWRVRSWLISNDLGECFLHSFHQTTPIHRNDTILLILSEHVLKQSGFENKIVHAFEKEKREMRKFILPIVLDDSHTDCAKEWVDELQRTRPLADFRNWRDHEQYRIQFENLLKILRLKKSPQLRELQFPVRN